MKAPEKAAKKDTSSYHQQNRDKAVAKKAAQANASNRFLNLPDETHLAILKNCLQSDTAIDICPEPFAFEVGWRQAKGPLHHARELGKAYHRGSKAKDISPSIAVLRACQKLHRIGADVLYGKNEFRFTNNAGVMGLEYFLYRIDQFVKHQHGQRIRQITVLHPGVMSLPNTLSNADAFFDGILYFSQICPGNPEHPKFSHRSRWFDQWHGTRGWSYLRAIKGLRHLRLVFPRGVKQADLAALQNVVPTIKDLKVTILRNNASTNSTVAWPELYLLEQMGSRYMLGIEDDLTAQQIADNQNARFETNWEAEEVYVDGHGFYTYAESCDQPKEAENPAEPEADRKIEKTKDETEENVDEQTLE